MAQLVSMTRNGRFVALRCPGGVDVVDVLGTAPRCTIAAPGEPAFACVGATLWVIDGDARQIRPGEDGELPAMALPGGDRRMRRFRIEGGELPSIALPAIDLIGEGRARSAARLLAGAGHAATTAMIDGPSQTLVEAGPALAVHALPADRRWFPLHGRRMVAVGAGVQLRTVGREDAVALPVSAGELVRAEALFGGRAIALWLRGEAQDALDVVSITGEAVHRIIVPRLTACAFAEDGGLAIAATDDELWAIDLRYGRIRTSARPPQAIAELAVDAEGRRLVLAGPGDDADRPVVSLVTYDELFRGRSDAVAVETVSPDGLDRPARATADFGAHRASSPSSLDEHEREHRGIGPERRAVAAIGRASDHDGADGPGQRAAAAIDHARRGEFDVRSAAREASCDRDGADRSGHRAATAIDHVRRGEFDVRSAARAASCDRDGADGSGHRAAADRTSRGEDAIPAGSGLSIERMGAPGSDARGDGELARLWRRVEEPDAELGTAPDETDATEIEIPELVLAALEPIAPAALPIAPEGAEPFERPSDHVAALLDLVAARAAVAVAEAWNSGRISRDAEDGLPFEHEVLGLIGESAGLAAEALHRARLRLAARAAAVRSRVLASLAAGMALPFIELARDFALSPHATQIVFCAAAPRLRGDVARLYGVLGGLAGRGAFDIDLAYLLIAEAPADRDQLAHELAGDASLVRSGLVRIEREPERVVLAVDDVLVDRLRGHHRARDLGAATVRRDADRALAEIRAPRALLRDLVVALADRDPARPARVVIRGRRGAGRHTIAAALAARAGRSLAAIDVARLPRAGAALAAALRGELIRAAIARAVPMISGLEAIEPGDAETRHVVRQVLADCAGPLFIRSSPDGDLPLDPEHVAVTLPALSIAERTSAWRDALVRRGLLPGVPDDGRVSDAAIDPGALAMRYRFGAGTIERVCGDVARRVRATAIPAAAARAIDDVARQHIAVRLGRVATRVERLPDWNQVTLLDDMRDSVRELIGRARHQRTVFEDWGFDRRITSARGLTALFYGPPGTGKTLVAGLIARELGLELWRIDLARVMSKWLGETEKNLAEVFDAAEDGQVMLLFDEADSLFAKRTEVKSSNDRYANLEVNYLLQRLDSFEGVAVLTTNLEGSVDSAFKRRLSMRLYFPFPDEDLRAELWAAHIPPEVPCDGDLDFAELARRFPLSGGYIRNSALRAAFLAAQERRALTQGHLIRAVQLEYRELGKIATTARIE